MTAAQADSSGAVPKNTDGFNIGASTYVTVKDTTVSNQDDCIAFQAGCNYVTVSNITCRGYVRFGYVVCGILIYCIGRMDSPLVAWERAQAPRT